MRIPVLRISIAATLALRIFGNRTVATVVGTTWREVDGDLRDNAERALRADDLHERRCFDHLPRWKDDRLSRFQRTCGPSRTWGLIAFSLRNQLPFAVPYCTALATASRSSR
jgi:hypothetical protein